MKKVVAALQVSCYDNQNFTVNIGKEAIAMMYKKKADNFISDKTTDRRNQLFSLETV